MMMGLMVGGGGKGWCGGECGRRGGVGVVGGGGEGMGGMLFGGDDGVGRGRWFRDRWAIGKAKKERERDCCACVPWVAEGGPAEEENAPPYVMD